MGYSPPFCLVGIGNGVFDAIDGDVFSATALGWQHSAIALAAELVSSLKSGSLLCDTVETGTSIDSW